MGNTRDVDVPTPEKEKPFYTQTWFWLLCAILLILLLTMLYYMYCMSQSQNDDYYDDPISDDDLERGPSPISKMRSSRGTQRRPNSRSLKTPDRTGKGRGLTSGGGRGLKTSSGGGLTSGSRGREGSVLESLRSRFSKRNSRAERS